VIAAVVILRLFGTVDSAQATAELGTVLAVFGLGAAHERRTSSTPPAPPEPPGGGG
jgi:hypothetical protein